MDNKPIDADKPVDSDKKIAKRLENHKKKMEAIKMEEMTNALHKAKTEYLKQKEEDDKIKSKIEETKFRSDCDTIMEAFEKMVQNHLPNKMPDLLNRETVYGDYMKLHNVNLELKKCYNINKVNNLVGMINRQLSFPYRHVFSNYNCKFNVFFREYRDPNNLFNAQIGIYSYGEHIKNKDDDDDGDFPF